VGESLPDRRRARIELRRRERTLLLRVAADGRRSRILLAHFDARALPLEVVGVPARPAVPACLALIVLDRCAAARTSERSDLVRRATRGRDAALERPALARPEAELHVPAWQRLLVVRLERDRDARERLLADVQRDDVAAAHHDA